MEEGLRAKENTSYVVNMGHQSYVSTKKAIVHVMEEKFLENEIAQIFNQDRMECEDEYCKGDCVA